MRVALVLLGALFLMDQIQGSKLKKLNQRVNRVKRRTFREDENKTQNMLLMRDNVRQHAHNTLTENNDNSDKNIANRIAVDPTQLRGTDVKDNSMKKPEKKKGGKSGKNPKKEKNKNGWKKEKGGSKNPKGEKAKGGKGSGGKKPNAGKGGKGGKGKNGNGKGKKTGRGKNNSKGKKEEKCDDKHDIEVQNVMEMKKKICEALKKGEFGDCETNKHLQDLCGVSSEKASSATDMKKRLVMIPREPTALGKERGPNIDMKSGDDESKTPKQSRSFQIKQKNTHENVFDSTGDVDARKKSGNQKVRGLVPLLQEGPAIEDLSPLMVNRGQNFLNLDEMYGNLFDDVGQNELSDMDTSKLSTFADMLSGLINKKK